MLTTNILLCIIAGGIHSLLTIRFIEHKASFWWIFAAIATVIYFLPMIMIAGILLK